MGAAVTASHQEYLARRTFGSLDGLRALSILAVLFHHTGGSTSQGAWNRGHLGVDLFFVISGFLIVTLLLRERAHTGAISLRAFYARRSLRILPLYYAVLLGTFVLTLGSDSTGARTYREGLPWALLYLTNWHVVQGMLSITWSLAAEEQFYLAWPLLQKHGGRVVIPILMVLLATCIALQVAHAAAGMPTGLPDFLQQASFTPILLGVGLAHLLHHQPSHALALRVLGPRAAAPLCLALLATCMLWPADDIDGMPRLLVHLAMAVLVTSCVVREDHGLAGVLRMRPLALVGVLSYGIYLLHGFAMHLSAALLQPPARGLAPLHFAFSTALSIAIAWVSYRWFESPFLRIKQRFARS